MVCHIFCSSLFNVAIAVFALIPQVPFHASHRYRQPHTRAGFHSLILFHWLHFTFRGYVFSNAYILVPTPHDAFSVIRFQHPTHNPLSFYFATIPLHSLITTSPYLFQRTVRAKKCAQTSCRQHPATALCASCVRGTRSTRIGSRYNALA